MNKKAQIGGVAFFIILLAVIILLAPIILKVAITIMDKTSSQLSTIDTTNKSSDLINFTKSKLTGTLDWAIMLIVLLDMLILMISAFLIDIHPAFVVIYIIGAIALVLTAPYSIVAAEKVYGMSQFSSGSNNVIQYIPMTEFMLNNFGVIIVAILVLTGIILYAKIKFFSQGGGGGGTY